MLNGPDIRKLIKSEAFTQVLPAKKLEAWIAIKAVIQDVLGKNRVDNEKATQLVKNMITAFDSIHASMTLKLHFMHHHLDVFLKQLPTESDEQGERFHQVTMPMERRFKGKKIDAMIAEVCWWSQKISRFEHELTEDDKEGHTEEDIPLFTPQTGNDAEDIAVAILSSESDDESNESSEPDAKKSRPSTSGTSTVKSSTSRQTAQMNIDDTD